MRRRVFTIQKALPLLNDGASIIINTSVASELGMVNGSVYAATKSALRSFTGRWPRNWPNAEFA